MIQTTKFVRKPFFVDGIQVTPENMKAVAEWCSGQVLALLPKNKTKPVEYIKVNVLRPLGERQTMAFVGDWVLYAGTGYKVYTSKAVNQNFDVVKDDEEEDEDDPDDEEGYRAARPAEGSTEDYYNWAEVFCD